MPFLTRKVGSRDSSEGGCQGRRNPTAQLKKDGTVSKKGFSSQLTQKQTRGKAKVRQKREKGGANLGLPGDGKPTPFSGQRTTFLRSNNQKTRVLVDV